MGKEIKLYQKYNWEVKHCGSLENILHPYINSKKKERVLNIKRSTTTAKAEKGY